MHSSNAARSTLFDNLSSWLDTPDLCYTSWISEQGYKRSTQIVYISMFSRFCEWLKSVGKRIDQCSPSDIQIFLESKNTNLPESRQGVQTGRQRQQYVRQLERVFSHLGSLGLNVQNPGREAAYAQIGHGRDHPTRFLTIAERLSVIQALQHGLAAAQLAGLGTDDWIIYRDFAIVAVLLGAGLKVGNLQFLTLNCIDLNEQRIELSNHHYTHRARIMDFALPSIRTWLNIQQQLNGAQLDGTQPMFIADRTAGFGRFVKTPLMHPSSIHRRTQRFLVAAGISGERSSAQTLRNTYAAMLIDGGASDDELIDFLGLKAAITADRLRSNYQTEKQMSNC